MVLNVWTSFHHKNSGSGVFLMFGSINDHMYLYLVWLGAILLYLDSLLIFYYDQECCGKLTLVGKIQIPLFSYSSKIF